MTIESFHADWEAQCRKIEAMPLPKNFQSLVDSAAERFGDRKAIDFFEAGVTLSYTQLREEVRRLASAFDKIGVRKGTHVGVLLQNEMEFPLSWLAIGHIGAVMVPTNVSYTGSELDYVYNDAHVEYLITDDSLLPAVLAMQQRPAILVDNHIIAVGDAVPDGMHSFATLIASGDPSFEPREPVAVTDILNIQYTSGTTGFPKGCMQEQRFWIVLGTAAASMNPTVGSLLTDHPYFYMDPLWQLVWGLHAGATIYAARKVSSSKFLARVRDHNIEWSWFPPPLLKLPEQPTDRDHSLRKFNCGPVSQSGILAAERRFGVPVRPGYGMTEIGGGTVVPDEVVDDEILATCGVRAPHRELRIVDPDGNDVTDGEPGELVVKGIGILTGYWNKPEATADSFYGDWFRTGDMFIKTPEGYFKIIGRFKDMIRRSSENISALEVESVATDLAEIAEAAAVPVPDDYRGEEVKLYVRLNDDVDQQSCSPERIVEHCSKKLAAFKVPRYIAYVGEFPHTASGKIAKPQLIAGVKDLAADCYDRERVKARVSKTEQRIVCADPC